MQDRSSGMYYLTIGQLSPIVAAAVLSLARDRFDPAARLTRDGRAIQTRLIHRAELDQLARDLAPKPCPHTSCGQRRDPPRRPPHIADLELAA